MQQTMRVEFDNQRRTLIAAHEAMVEEMKESHEHEVKTIVIRHEDIVRKQQVLIVDSKEAFERVSAI